MLNRIKTHLKKIPRSLHAPLGIIFIILTLIILSRVYAAIKLRNQTNAHSITTVLTISATPLKGNEQLVLPGNVRAWHEATIYARTDGYIKKWYVDIGSHVKAGELLAEIETPELDAQLHQAEADLNTAIAKNELAQSTAKRWRNLLKSDSVSKQETNEKISEAAALDALVISARANVDRLKKLVGFERVIAPFDGTITSRTTDIGTLINAGSTIDGVALFKIVQTNPLRVYVEVPQNYSSTIFPKMVVTLKFAEHPGQEFSATLIQTAQAINQATRTLLAQFKVENNKGVLLPGGYTQVFFTIPIAPNTFRIPVNTLLFQSAGLEIATVNQDQRVVLKPITISRDFGDEVEVRAGINVGEQIIVNPPDALNNGEKVRVSR